MTFYEQCNNWCSLHFNTKWMCKKKCLIKKSIMNFSESRQNRSRENRDPTPTSLPPSCLSLLVCPPAPSANKSPYLSFTPPVQPTPTPSCRPCTWHLNVTATSDLTETHWCPTVGSGHVLWHTARVRASLAVCMCVCVCVCLCVSREWRVLAQTEAVSQSVWTRSKRAGR